MPNKLIHTPDLHREFFLVILFKFEDVYFKYFHRIFKIRILNFIIIKPLAE